MSKPWLAHVLSRLTHRSPHSRLAAWPDVSRLLSARLAVEQLEDRATPAVFTVLNTNDSGPDSLRQAVIDSNAMTGPDTVAFNIGGGGAQTISPTSALPTITDQVTIDGTTQPGFAGVPLIELNGSSAGTGFVRGLSISAGNSTVRGLVINRFASDAILLQSGGGNRIEGNYLGIDATGTVALGNGGGPSGSAAGVYVVSGNNTIGGDTAADRNVIAGHRYGVRFGASTATNNVVAGNYIGTDKTGTLALGNDEGVFFQIAAANNRIGRIDPGPGNVISGNRYGITFHDQLGVPTGNIISGNLIGTTADGTAALGNTGGGILLSGGQNNRIGGTTASERNVISGNGGAGIVLSSFFSAVSGNVILGNHIGTDVTGTVDLGNADDGVRIQGSATGNTVGGSAAGARNVISGNDDNGVGLYTGATGNLVAGNFIGTDVSGTLDLGNGIEGINVINVSNNTVGGSAAGAGNVISGNGAHGVYISGSSGTVLVGNLIGTNAAGTVALGNSGYGVVIRDGSTSNRVGTDADGLNDLAERNVISGNLLSGVVFDAAANGNVVAGNYIGTDANGNTLIPGTVSWWKAEGNATDAVDGNHGTPANGATFIAGKVGQAYNLRGGTDYISAPHNANLQLANGFTIEAWVRPTGTLTGKGRIVSKGDPLGGALSEGFGFGRVGGRLEFTTYGLKDYDTAASYLALDTWTHVAIVFDSANTAHFYVNGQLVESVTGPAAARPTTRPLFIGTLRVTGQEGWTGDIDEVAIYNRTLTTAEIQAIHAADSAGKAEDLGNKSHGVQVAGGSIGNTIGGPTAAARNVIAGNVADGVNLSGTTHPAGTVSWWKAEGNAADSIGSATGTPVGGVTFAPGKSGQAFSFNGTTSQVDVAPNAALDFGTGDFSLDVWVNFNTVSVAQAIFHKSLGTFPNDQTFFLQFNASNALRFVVRDTTANANDLAVPTALVSGQWYHVVAVRQGDTNSLYLDGVLIGSQTAGSNVNTGAGGSARIGNLAPNGTGTNRFLNGRVDELALYGRALTTSEIATIYQIGGPAKGRNVIQGNRIGTDPDGVRDLGNKGDGVEVNNSPGILIAGNLISGNDQNGTFLIGAGTVGTRIEGNFIGTNAAGTSAVGNSGGGGGVYVLGGASFNTIGGTAPGAGNVISGNSGSASEGVEIENAGGTMIYGNIIGLDATGTFDIGNKQAGVFLDRAFDTMVGGPTAAHRNVISGNDAGFAAGVWMNLAQATNNRVQGNYIGTDKTGTKAVPNAGPGVRLSGGANNNLIGTNADGVDDVGERNVISGNQSNGVLFTDAGTNNNVVAGNYIGTDAAGSGKLANVQGVFVQNSASNNTIGGAASGAGNLISGNFANGVVLISGAAGNVVRGNTIGTDVTGTLDRGNDHDGVHVLNAPNNAILGNLISGNNRNGVWLLQSGSTGNLVAGNRIGTNAAGTAAVGNSGTGVHISSGAINNFVGVNGDGVNDTAEGNIISGNLVHGVHIASTGTNNNVVAGNLIGTDASGAADLGNAGHGVLVTGQADDTRIGTNADGVSDAVERNVISGNDSWNQVGVADSGTDRTVIVGNYVGTNKDGTAAIIGGGHSIAVYNGADDTRIGTDGNGVFDAAERNVISGNLYGLLVVGLGSDRTVIAGNYIGTNAAGDAKLPNGDGITVRFGAADTRIGTDGSNDAFNAAERNVISGNNWVGIFVQTPEWYGEVPAGGATTDRTVIAGNYIGLNAAGTAALGNASAGIYAPNRVTNLRIGTDANGVADEAERNVISGNGGAGVQVEGWTFLNLLIADQFVSGAIPRTTATATVGQADFADATSAAAGNWTINNPIPGGGGDYYAFRAIGTVRVNVAGTFTFALGSDNGGRLRIDGADVVVYDVGHQPFATPFGTVTLMAGTHTFEWVGYEQAGAAGFELTVALGGGRTGPITEADGWRVLGAASPHSEIALEGSISATAYYPDPGPLNISIAGNYIGTNPAGAAAVPNAGVGVLLIARAQGVRIGTNGDGVNDAAERNVISGNTGRGIQIQGAGTDGNVVAGNIIGTDVTGTADLGNGGNGIAIVLGAKGNLIGTDGDGVADAAERNLVSGNKNAGIFISDTGTESNVVAGNFIGTDVSGSVALPNGGAGGVRITGGAQTNRIGTDGDGVADAAERNLISGNTNKGVRIDGVGSDGNVVAGNFIGTNADGTAALGNLIGVLVEAGASNNTIGGTAAGAGNLIAFNAGTGLLIQGAVTTGNAAAHNRVFANAGGNIVLLDGPNPTAVIPDLRAVLTGATTRVIGTLAAAPLASYRLELYASDPTIPEARQLLGEVVVTATATAAGTVPLDFVVPIATLPSGGFTLLATRLDTGDTGSLSASVPAALVVVDGAPTAAVPEGIPLTFATRATDPGPGETVAYDWRVTRGGAVVGEGDEAVFSFTPDDNGAYILTLTVRTSTGQVDAIDPVPIAVANTAPVVEFVAFPESAPPGAPFDVLARVTDLGTADTFTHEWRVWRDGTPVTVPAPVNPLQFTFTPAANGLYEVELTVRDDDLSVGTRRVAVIVQGQVPEAQIDIQTEGKEGATVHARAALSAILAQDQLTFEWTATKNGVLYAAATGVGVPNFEFVPDDNGVYVVGLRLSTPFASFMPPTRSVVVANVIPEARIGYDANADGVPDASPPTLTAGTAIPFLGTVRDVGAADVHTLRWSILNSATGQVVRQGVGPTLSFTPPIGGTYVVTLIAEDDDGGLTEVSASVEVAALTRVVQINLPAAAPSEGDAVNLTATVTPADGVALRYAWEVRKDGAVVASADSGTFTTTPLPLAFTPTDDGRYEVRLSVTGADGSTGEGVKLLDVVNVVPTVAIGTVPPSLAEGAQVIVSATGFDPGSQDGLTYRWTVTLGGTPVATADGPTLTFTPADDGDYTLRVEVRDDDQPELFGFDTAVLHVINVAPTVMIRTATDPDGNPTFPPDEAGFQFHLTSGTFDPGTDTLLYAWSVARIDAAGVSHPLPGGLHSPANRPTFSFSPDGQPGTYVVSLTVDDQEGGVTTQMTRILAGTAGNDTLTVTPNDLVGGATSVLVVAGQGADTIDATGVTFAVALDGGDGDDTITGGTGADVILGGAGTDSLVGGAGDDTLVTQHGDDTVVGGDGGDVYIIVPGSDATVAESGVGGIDVINFAFAEQAVTFDLTAAGVFQTVDAAGNRVLFTGTFEAVEGSAFADRLTAASNTTVFGGDGADQLIVGDSVSAVTVFGGDGVDTIEVLGASDVTVFGGEGDDLVRLADGASAVTVFGGAGLDDIEVTAAADVTVFGGDGADEVTLTSSTGVTVYGGAGSDTIRVVGGSGIAVFGGDAEGELTPALDAITIFGGSGDDTIEVQSATNATVFGGDGLDTISVLSGSTITVFGGDGDDDVVVATPGGLVTVFGGAGADEVDVSAGSAVTVFGGEGDDELRVLAGAGANITVFGGEGDDSMEVAAGSAVTVFGGEGLDEIAVTGGADVTVFGEGGDDVLSVLGGTGVTVFGGDGADDVTVAGGTSVTVFGGDGPNEITVQGGSQVTVFGGDADDVIAVSGGVDVTVFGGEGADAITLTGGGTNITVFGGVGDDDIEAAAATATGVTIFGDAGDDDIAVTAGNGVTVFGGEGVDTIAVGGKAGSQITVFGGDGADDLSVSAGSAVTVFGGEGDDTALVTGGTNVTVFGGEGNDLLEAAALTGSNVTLFGEGGDDTLTVSAGSGVTVFGGDGADTILVQEQAGQDITVFGGEGVDDVAVSAGTDVTVFGGEGDDNVAVSAGSQVTVFGGAGVDTLTVSGGSGVTVFGGEGDDVAAVSAGSAVTVFGGEGDDTISVTGGTAVTVFGGEGADAIEVAAPMGSQITVFGGEGDDAITVSAGGGITVFGGEGDDELAVTGDAGSQITVFGGDGGDAIVVDAGSQVTVFGEGGDDSVTVAAGVGSDITVFGGDGTDVIAVDAGTLVTVFGEAGADVLTTGGGSAKQVNLFGGADADAITVAAGSQVTVFGGSGEDLLAVTAGTGVTLLGERGDDDLSAAGVSNVTLFGGAGNDRLHGTGGVEISLYGDDGDDTYRVTADAVRETRVRVKEIQTLGAGHEPDEKGTTSGTDHIDRPSFGAETLDLSAFHAITLDLNVLGTDLDPLAGWQTLSDLTGRTAVIVLHGFFENVIGTDGADLITGNQFANRLDGRGGNDTLTGLAGDDVLEGGAGDDSLTGGADDDTYVFAGTGLGADAVIEAADQDSDTLDFSGLAGAVSVDLGSAAAQAQPDGTFTLSDGRGLENVIGSGFADTIVGNVRNNILEGGAGNDSVSGGAGADTYRFAGEVLGTDTLTESGTDADTLDFAGLLGGLSLDLTTAGAQGSAGAGAFVALADPTLFEGVIGTAFPDVIKGNGADNVLIGGGGRDHLDGGAGNDVLRGGSGQVIYLDFTSATDPWDWQYDAAQRQAIRDNLAQDFAPFGYAVTLALPAAGQFLTIRFNDDQPGGRSDGIDFRNTVLGGTATVNVNGLLDDLAAALLAAGVLQADIDANWARFVADLSAHVAGHEAGHSLGLRHGDAYGPIGTGVNTLAQGLRYLPDVTAVGATETGWHLMSSPASVGTSLADSARDTFLGLREAIKLAHADTGTTVREAAPGYNAHDTIAEAVDLGRFHGLSVPNTLRRPADPFFGQSLSVASVALLGSITGGAGLRSEDDFYAFAAAPGEWFHFEVNSFVLGRVGNPIDSVLRIYDAAGNLLAWNDDEFETPDAVILDWQAAVAGTYYVVVDTFTPDGVRDFDTGTYELFAYRIAVGPDLGLGDTIVTGSGTDTVFTSAASDTVKLSEGSTTTVVAASAALPVVENLSGADFTAFDPAGNTVTVPEKTVNTPPELGVFTFPAGLQEGQLFTATATATDAETDDGDRLTFRLEAAAGETLPKGLTIDAATGDLRWTLMDNGTYHFRVVVSDTSGAEDFVDVTAVVGNVNPTAVVTGPAQVDEGVAATFTAVGSDVGALDTLTYAWTVDGAFAGAGPSLTFLPTDNRDHAVVVTVTDKDGGSVTLTRTLTVKNVVPVAAIISMSGALVETGAVTLVGLASDAGGPSAITGRAWTVTVNGSVVATGAGDGISFTAADNGDYVVTFTVTDKNGATAAASRTVRVTNAAPVVGALPHLTLGEADLAVFNGSFADNPVDAPFTLLWRVTGPNGPGPGGTASTFSFLPPDAGEYEVLFKVTDKDGADGVARGRVSVAETAPTATFAQSGTADEGSVATVAFTAPRDAPADLSAGLRYSFDLDGDGKYEIVDSTSPTAGRLFVESGTYTVRGKVTDKDGKSTEYSATLTVRNVAPVAGPITAPMDPTAVGALIGVSATFSDVGVADTHTARWDWGDGTFSAAAVSGYGVTGSHTYAKAGVYTVTLTVRDDDGAEHQSVFRYVTVYDTEAGSVTGNGWFESPAGAYAPNPALSGKANFGFLSRYAKGDSTPSGRLSLRLRDFAFESTAYEWMVISEPRGILKGIGTVNGVGGYGFLISGFDSKDTGEDDRLRIKIWVRSTGAVVYDNQPGAPDDAVPTMAIGAGNIVIIGSNGLVGPSAVAGAVPALTATQLRPLIAEALARWAAAGLAVDGLAGLPVRVADLPGGTLGLVTPGGIWIDLNAAGVGWFVDPTPADDAEFRTPGDQGEEGRIDLLTVLMHEIGHLLGHDHEAEGLMGESLTPGVRRLPDHGPAVSVAPWPMSEPVTAVPQTPVTKAVARPTADNGQVPSLPASRETEGETSGPAGWVAPDKAEWIDWPDEWWGVALDP